MIVWQELARSRRERELPTDVHISLVDALFSDPRSLLIGSIAASFCTLVTVWKTGEALFLFCAMAMMFVACARALDMRAYARNRPTTSEAATRWEQRYVIGAAAYVALLGTWVLIAFAKTSDPFVHLISFSATLAYLIGISGRNFASDRLVGAQILCAAVPMTVALFLAGNPYYAVLALVLIPFFASLKFISDRLRRTLLDAVITGRDFASLASRFDTALNNMPHGLCMFDAERRLVVSNMRLAELLGVAPEVARKGASALELLVECVRAATISGAGAERFVSDFNKGLAGRVNGPLHAEIRDGRALALTFQPMDNGGSVVLVEDITERRNAEAKINHLARYDALTGLPNRTFFRDKMDNATAAMRPSDSCAVLFIDLDEFKQVNDTLGHPCGDELLCAVADRLRGVVRETDIVARFAGDEFVVLQLPVKRPDDAASMARLIVESLGEPYDIDGHQIVIGASVGIAMASGDKVDGDLLLKNADMALYRAKSDGRSAWRFFEPEMDVRAQARRSLELELRSTLANEAFEVYYQPLLNLRTRRISTCEALLRWPHPTRGMIPPGEFIPVAEEMGLIVELGDWVLREACIECTRWPGDVRVAVNLSPIQFKRGNVVRSVRDVLAATGLPANRLELEITESVLLQDTEATRICLHQLRDIGVRISLDDFGTGYSSLSYLHSFPLHKVKIDRSFLQGIAAGSRSMTLLRGVARLSTELGMSVTMEGIETEEQLSLIAGEAGIDEAQGFLFSPAVPNRDIRRLLSSAPSLMEKVA